MLRFYDHLNIDFEVRCGLHSCRGGSRVGLLAAAPSELPRGSCAGLIGPLGQPTAAATPHSGPPRAAWGGVRGRWAASGPCGRAASDFASWMSPWAHSPTFKKGAQLGEHLLKSYVMKLGGIGSGS